MVLKPATDDARDSKIFNRMFDGKVIGFCTHQSIKNISPMEVFGLLAIKFSSFFDQCPDLRASACIEDGLPKSFFNANSIASTLQGLEVWWLHCQNKFFPWVDVFKF